MEKIYLDYAATTPVDERVLEKMNSVTRNYPGNASSVHSFGRASARILDQAREDVSKTLNCNFNEVIFTSGATESNNLAILGLLKRFQRSAPERKFHLITTNTEHSSVLDVFKYLEKQGLAEITILPVNESGVVDHNQVKEAIRENTILVSIIYANNELGSINPIRKIGKIVRKINENREREIMNRKSNGEKLDFNAYNLIYFHTDAVQAVNYLNIDVTNLLVDLLTLSGHKIYGPKGVSALFVKEGTPLKQIMFGGEQELSNRPGTYNLPAIVGLAEALKITAEMREGEVIRLNKLKDGLKNQLAKIDGVIFNTQEETLPNILNFSLPKISGEILMLKLDQRGIAVSTGSACASGSVEPSHVLAAITKDKARINSAIRISMGRQTTAEELALLTKILAEVISKA